MTQEEYKEEARRLRPQLLQTARRYLSEDDAEDTVQDVLLRLWQMVDTLRMPINALATVLVRNFCIDRLRRQRLRVGASAGMKPLQALTANCEQADENENDERIERVLAMIDALPTLQQTILRLRHIEGMEMREIAELTGSSEVAIRKTLSRARQTLKQQYVKRYER
jgi:RNA polymerase sigma-70 factor (ECF subfamily)